VVVCAWGGATGSIVDLEVSFVLRFKVVIGAILSSAVLGALMPLPAAAAPVAGGFGPGIDRSAYTGQEKCDPVAKPGVVAFTELVMGRYPDTSSSGITRACNIGGKSEHKEGRAWDWAVNAEVPSQKAMADQWIAGLEKTDRYGNEAARARRFGIMYLIWNRQIWFPGSGWRVYCVQKDFGCHTPGDQKSIRHPHTDHVHFSFTWDGAMKRTTYWRPDRSMVAAIATHPVAPGYWIATRNGGVAPIGLWSHGSLSEKALASPVVASEATPTGGGYWLLTRSGQVSAFGDAGTFGHATDKTSRAVGLAPSAGGKGYWVVARGGNVLAFGGAPRLGGVAKTKSSPVKGIEPTPSGKGYWVIERDGKVTAFGDAPQRRDLAGRGFEVAGMSATPTGKGYWIFNEKGVVKAFGDAAHHGDRKGKDTPQQMVAMGSTPGGSGYWLVGHRGRVYAFGDAKNLGSVKTMARVSETYGLTATHSVDPDDPTTFPDH
jgi:hypothetical protein